METAIATDNSTFNQRVHTNKNESGSENQQQTRSNSSNPVNGVNDSALAADGAAESSLPPPPAYSPPNRSPSAATAPQQQQRGTGDGSVRNVAAVGRNGISHHQKYRNYIPAAATNSDSKNNEKNSATEGGGAAAALEDNAEAYRNLIVNYIPTAVTDQHLRQLFEPYGVVEESRIIISQETKQSRGFGFVKFATIASATAALNALNGYPILNKRLKISYACIESDVQQNIQQRVHTQQRVHQRQHAAVTARSGTVPPPVSAAPIPAPTAPSSAATAPAVAASPARGLPPPQPMAYANQPPYGFAGTPMPSPPLPSYGPPPTAAPAVPPYGYGPTYPPMSMPAMGAGGGVPYPPYQHQQQHQQQPPYFNPQANVTGPPPGATMYGGVPPQQSMMPGYGYAAPSPHHQQQQQGYYGGSSSMPPPFASYGLAPPHQHYQQQQQQHFMSTPAADMNMGAFSHAAANHAMFGAAYSPSPQQQPPFSNASAGLSVSTEASVLGASNSSNKNLASSLSNSPSSSTPPAN